MPRLESFVRFLACLLALSGSTAFAQDLSLIHI